MCEQNWTGFHVLTLAGPATWPTRGTSWHQSRCRECEAAARRDCAPPPWWPPAPATGQRARLHWPSTSPRPRCGSSMSGLDCWCSAGRPLRKCSEGMGKFLPRCLSEFKRGGLTSFYPPIPWQAAVWLNTCHKDRQLPALAAPASSHGHAQRLVGLLFHSDVFLLTAHTLGQVLGSIITKTGSASKQKEKYLLLWTEKWIERSKIFKWII